jgi:4-hydroxybenzoate polyprenyltransferase
MLVDLIALARPTQWIKNGVVLAALVFGGEVGHFDKVILALIAAVVFCLLSSVVYTLNDLADRRQDQVHPLKKDRPLASGRISATQAWTFALVLVVLAAALSLALTPRFLAVAGAYVALNVLYSLVLKHVVIIDVMTIAMGFVLRAVAGTVAIGVPASHWLLIMTLLLALFLGFGKRRHELLLLEDDASSHRRSLSKYSPYLLDQCMGVTTASVVVMYMFYTFSPEVTAKLGTPYLYLTIPFVVYGVFRYLYLMHREAKGGSPTQVLIDDKPILAAVVLWLAAVIVILYLV